MSTPLGKSSAIVLQIGDRFFCGFTKGRHGRVQRAWSLAGATLFLPADRAGDHHKLQDAERRLNAAGKTWTRRVVVLTDG